MDGNQFPETRSVYDISKDYIDYKMGVVAGGLMGVIVAAVNASHGAVGATTAGAKQFSYTLVAGGIVTKLCENLAVRSKNKFQAYATAIIVPSIIAISATYGVHKMKGTPEPFDSTVPTMIMAPPGFAYWANRKRKKLEDIIE
ncbi:hypothetical protein ACFL1B_03805 [Nanoarchaeota archaeon]